MIWLDYYLFTWLQGERGVLGELGWLLTREQAVYRAVNLNWSPHKHFTLIETQVRQESFSTLYPTFVSVKFCNCKVCQKLKSCVAPWWYDTPDEEGEERHWEIRQKLAVHPGLTLKVEPSWAELRWGEKTCIYCRVNWPGFKWWEYPFPLHTKPWS